MHMSKENSSQNRLPRVLVVDDDITVRLLARQSLERAGFAVAEAEDGSEAVSAFQETRPHLVLLDVDMPTMDGFQACAQLRRRDLTIKCLSNKKAPPDRRGFLNDSSVISGSDQFRDTI
jgi:CheY-like chemotaxis protein